MLHHRFRLDPLRFAQGVTLVAALLAAGAALTPFAAARQVPLSHLLAFGAAMLVANLLLVGTLLRQVAAARLRRSEKAQRDGLTGLANRRRFEATLAQEWSRAARGGYPLALLVIDLDGFKAYNDLYGHLAGDDCLRHVAALLAAGLRRPGDLASRHGGASFALLLPATAIDGATVLAEGVREALAAAGLAHAASNAGRVTASIGVSCAHPTPDRDGQPLVHAAQRALQLAKAAGRDRVRVQLAEPALALVRATPAAARESA